MQKETERTDIRRVRRQLSKRMKATASSGTQGSDAA